MHARLFAPADKQLFDAQLLGDLLERLLGVANRQRHQNGPGPGRNFVDVEPEPLGKKNDLRRNGGDSIVIVLPEETQIDLGKGVDLGDAAHFQNPLAGANQVRVIGGIARQLQSEIAFDRSADIGWAAEVDTPSAIFVLLLQNVARSFRHALRTAGAQKNVQDDVVGFERGIGFQFAAPVTIFVLLGKQAVAGAVNGRGHPADEIINFSETHLRHRRGGR